MFNFEFTGKIWNFDFLQYFSQDYNLNCLLLIRENNFIQMAASVEHAVAYTIGAIFNHIIDCVQLYFTNGFTNILPFKVSIVSSLLA